MGVRKIRSTKHGTRNNFQHAAQAPALRVTEIQMFKTVQVTEAEAMILSLTFCHLIFEFVSDFEIRISNFLMAAK
jgi:hypothetical protein